MKINHAERVKQEAKKQTGYCGAEFYDGLVEQAAGHGESEADFEKATAGLVNLGAKNDGQIEHLVLQYGYSMRDNGFNAGFELGFQQGALLAAYGRERDKAMA